MPAFNVIRMNAHTVSASPVNNGKSRNTSRFSSRFKRSAGDDASSSSTDRILPRTKNHTTAWIASESNTTVPDKNALSPAAAVVASPVASDSGSAAGRTASDNKYASPANTTPTANAERK